VVSELPREKCEVKFHSACFYIRTIEAVLDLVEADFEDDLDWDIIEKLIYRKLIVKYKGK